MTLRGWVVRNSKEGKSPLVIYFDGSGSQSWRMIPYARKLGCWSMALVPYRGFGSTSLPGIRPSPLFAPLSGIIKPHVVPHEQSLRLVGRWGGETVVKTYANEDHSLHLHDNGSWTDSQAFLRRFARSGNGHTAPYRQAPSLDRYTHSPR